jgi:hypothetical protein
MDRGTFPDPYFLCGKEIRMTIEKIWVPMCQNYKGYLEILNQYDFPSDKGFNFFFNLEPLFDRIYSNPEVEFVAAVNKKDAIKDICCVFINVFAHYRHFFKLAERDAKLYFYYSGFDVPFVEKAVYEPFREMYVSKYTKNKKHSNLSKIFHSEIMPRIIELIEDVENIFIIRTDGFDSSLVPYIYSKQSDRTSLLLSYDFYDSLYLTQELASSSVYPLYIRRKKKNPIDPRMYTRRQIAMDLSKGVNAVVCDKPFYYKALAAAHGSKVRSLYGIKQYDDIAEILNGLYENGLADDYNGDTLITEHLKGSDKEDFHDAFQMFDLEYHASLIPATSIININDIIKSPRHNMAFYQDYFMDRDVNLDWLTG